MYATNSTSAVYHLVVSAQDTTICGLPVVLIIIDREALTSTLHLTSESPAGLELCKHCARAERERILK